MKKGETFRTAHEIVGKLVNYAAEKGKTFAELDIKEYKKFSPRFGEDVYKITVESSLAARNVPGGTAPEQVKKALAKARRMVKMRNRMLDSNTIRYRSRLFENIITRWYITIWGGMLIVSSSKT